MAAHLSRRRFLGAATGGGLALLAGGRPARAESGRPRSKYFVLGLFSGGWDQLLALDPRDHRLSRFQPAEAYAPQGTGIHPAYDRLTDPESRALLQAVPSGVQTVAGSALTFGPAIPRSLLAHARELSIIRGIDMGTLTHETGRDSFFTGWPTALNHRRVVDPRAGSAPEDNALEDSVAEDSAAEDSVANLLTSGAASAVTIELASGLDDHDEGWASGHAPQLRAGFGLLARMISRLKTTPDPEGGSCWDHATLLCVSDLARTPLLNGRGGRDHHLVSSCLVGGAGLRGGVVAGGTSDVGMGSLQTIRPSEVLATVFHAMRVDDGARREALRPLEMLLAA